MYAPPVHTAGIVRGGSYDSTAAPTDHNENQLYPIALIKSYVGTSQLGLLVFGVLHARLEPVRGLLDLACATRERAQWRLLPAPGFDLQDSRPMSRFTPCSFVNRVIASSLSVASSASGSVAAGSVGAVASQHRRPARCTCTCRVCERCAAGRIGSGTSAAAAKPRSASMS